MLGGGSNFKNLAPSGSHRLLGTIVTCYHGLFNHSHLGILLGLLLLLRTEGLNDVSMVEVFFMLVYLSGSDILSHLGRVRNLLAIIADIYF